MAKYVYGIVEETAAPPTSSGIDDRPLHVIAGSGAGALVSDLAADERKLGREDLLAHGRVLEQALAGGPVLPMRFGMVMQGDAEVRERLLEPHAAELGRQLAELTGKVEMRVRVVYEEEPLLRTVVAADPELARLRGQAGYHDQIELGERVTAGIQRRRELDGEELLEALAPLVAGVEVAEPPHERVAFNASFLVDRKRTDEFDAALEALARDRAELMRFTSTGPMAPHSFVELAGSV